jgi:hypothetical protein
MTKNELKEKGNLINERGLTYNWKADLVMLVGSFLFVIPLIYIMKDILIEMRNIPINGTEGYFVEKNFVT